jgi:hypothetical protein
MSDGPGDSFMFELGIPVNTTRGPNEPNWVLDWFEKDTGRSNSKVKDLLSPMLIGV